MPGTQILYKRHRQWALTIAADHGGSDEDRLTALLALAKACQHWRGGPDFRVWAQPRIEGALHQTRATA